MWSVTAPPQNPLTGESTQFSLVLYGALGGVSGAWVWVNPAMAVRRGPEIFGAQPRRGAEFATTSRIAKQFEPPAERGQCGEIGMARPAGLSGLAGETRQSLGRRRETNSEEIRENDRPNRGDVPEMPQAKRKTTAIAPHGAPSNFIDAFHASIRMSAPAQITITINSR
jgi:hypothetical protein